MNCTILEGCFGILQSEMKINHVCITCNLAGFDEFIFQVHHITGYHMCLYLLVKTLIVPSGALGAFVLYDIILLLEMSVPLRFSLITF